MPTPRIIAGIKNRTKHKLPVSQNDTGGQIMKTKMFKLSSLLLAFVLLCSLTVTVSAAEIPDLIPGGAAVGLNIKSDGVMVIGLNSVSASGESPAKDAGIRSGDIITHIGSERVASAAEVRDVVARCGGGAISVQATRNGKSMQFQVIPAMNQSGNMELGVWLRDSIAGIGTITFINPVTGDFGALGHSIGDGVSDTPLPLNSGIITQAEIYSVVKGISGTPGQLRGDANTDAVIGSLTENTVSGVFGKIIGKYAAGSAIPAAERNEIKVGPATIYSNVSGTEVREYRIEITKVYPEGSERDMLILISDPNLIAATGGIVQGMSGSPIIQNGKLVGAVTHVLVGDPLRGYGVSIERMLAAITN
ncbi:MAG: SpoIVB peptidase [Oscillospiraceae bacterium]|nr:SpoIVB peptidase [Oscillospiraceae bacterium]